ncbi:acetyl/propionyl/methylcrotonyl-CoA carboxylase subunit alpha [Altericroceibacterium endophyticum]|uniref:ATP-grasp domain-containing protein n=1 Tax=Altericroceibacterium endophyticum TaxID=1808508 RepID=A0A6I4T9C6_9SPHN|nr:acetyl/propionyl/methylcrotonyl-CoA carboxylase subunit alpha [Altericroceibacterium endophyticum]MXO66999.1 ATP-grasp domain-containing protein [Altericroceibacterium endophyticum]
MIQSLLIANRGEIACRIIRTTNAMNIRTIAVYSDADAGALHVQQADDAVRIGPPPAAESYLRGEAIIAAAKSSGAEAIHPGYGFLSENSEFAQAVIDAGLIWVGPKPDSIRAMGLKDAAKQLMRDAGVPVTPGYDGTDQSPERLAQEAEQIGYPVLIKAVAGGGGKGMRKVDRASDFAASLESCRREAQASFGNDHVLLEKWITSPRHIEVQIFGDSHGNAVHLFERDCSLQRRHQKVIEEAPAPGMDAATREQLCAAAVRAAKAVDYVGAGTVEFIADGNAGTDGGLSADNIFFMEMNTRLQVEHPVTEEITRVDLVEWQLRVASGEPIPLAQDDLTIRGHAIEARLYAEDPSSGFLPSTGRLDHFHLSESGRVETGVAQTHAISPHYDPMIAKLIYHADTREQAVDGLQKMVAETQIWPVKTNAAFLARALDHPDFRSANLDTGFIAAHEDALIPSTEPNDQHWRIAARAIQDHSAGGAEPKGLMGFRLNAPTETGIWVGYDGEFRSVEPAGQAALASVTGDRGPITFDSGQAIAFDAVARGTGQGAIGDGAILAPMPGKIIAVDVAAGDSVEEGQRLLVMEAMKMEHTLTAPFTGIVTDLPAQQGAQVQVDTLLARIEPAE